jgi:hypothetical protein
MHTAKEVSIGGRRQVRDDGNDVCDSESDSKNEDRGETLTGTYTSEIEIGKDGRPVNSGYRLPEDQANALRASAPPCAGESKGSTTQA